METEEKQQSSMAAIFMSKQQDTFRYLIITISPSPSLKHCYSNTNYSSRCGLSWDMVSTEEMIMRSSQ